MAQPIMMPAASRILGAPNRKTNVSIAVRIITCAASDIASTFSTAAGCDDRPEHPLCGRSCSTSSR
jgi:hypothetical protein